MADFDADGMGLSEETRERLDTIRHKLLSLHKSILDAERASYERAHGRVENPHALLQLVMRDPWFGWFRPLSEMVVQIDEMLESKEPVPESAAEELMRDDEDVGQEKYTNQKQVNVIVRTGRTFIHTHHDIEHNPLEIKDCETDN